MKNENKTKKGLKSSDKYDYGAVGKSAEYLADPSMQSFRELPNGKIPVMKNYTLSQIAKGKGKE